MMGSFLRQGKFVYAKSFLKRKIKVICPSNGNGKAVKNIYDAFFWNMTLQHNIFRCVKPFQFN